MRPRSSDAQVPPLPTPCHHRRPLVHQHHSLHPPRSHARPRPVPHHAGPACHTRSPQSLSSSAPSHQETGPARPGSQRRRRPRHGRPAHRHACSRPSRTPQGDSPFPDWWNDRCPHHACLGREPRRPLRMLHHLPSAPPCRPGSWQPGARIPRISQSPAHGPWETHGLLYRRRQADSRRQREAASCRPASRDSAGMGVGVYMG